MLSDFLAGDLPAESEITQAWSSDAAVPLVSIICLSYNHCHFIRDALNGFLKQKTSFRYQVVVHDDASTDDTPSIIRAYQQDYPELIKPILQAENIYSKGGDLSAAISPYLLGGYVALCEGDDFWCDPYKLQCQVDFLESNPDYSASYHNAYVCNTRSGVSSTQLFHESPLAEDYSTKDLIRPWFLPTASCVIRRSVFDDLPKWSPEVESGDIKILLCASLKGQVKYFNRPMSVYRLHTSGLSLQHIGNRKAFAMIHLYQSFNLQTGRAFQDLVWHQCISELCYHLEYTAKLQIASSLHSKHIFYLALLRVVESVPFSRRLLFQLRRLGSSLLNIRNS